VLPALPQTLALASIKKVIWGAGAFAAHAVVTQQQLDDIAAIRVKPVLRKKNVCLCVPERKTFVCYRLFERLCFKSKGRAHRSRMRRRLRAGACGRGASLSQRSRTRRKTAGIIFNCGRSPFTTLLVIQAAA
jgi:hypothetical protein